MNLVVQHTVKDYDAWKSVFDEHESVRAKHGATGHTVYRDADDPNSVTSFIRFETREGAEAFRAPDALETLAASATAVPPSTPSRPHNLAPASKS